jgi:hypothetical protein
MERNKFIGWILATVFFQVYSFFSVNALGIKSINIGTGPSFNGNGDLYGNSLFMKAKFNMRKNSRLSLNIDVSGNTHSRYQELTYMEPVTNLFTYSGLYLISSNNTLSTSFGYNLFKKNIKINIESGIDFNRFTSNFPPQFGYIFPALTNYPIPLVAIAYYEKPKSYLSFGGHVAIDINVCILKHLSLGFGSHLMLDNKGNVLISSLVQFGYTF